MRNCFKNTTTKLAFEPTHACRVGPPPVFLTVHHVLAKCAQFLHIFGPSYQASNVQAGAETSTRIAHTLHEHAAAAAMGSNAALESLAGIRVRIDTCIAKPLVVQEWTWLQAAAAQQIMNHNFLALAYVAGRAAAVPPWLRAATAAARLTQHNVHGQGLWPAPGLRETMACSCRHDTCFKVLKCDSVQRGLQRGSTDPLACPACSVHKDVSHTYSPLVEEFLNIVQGMWPGVSVIWNWVDIPGLPNYHFDATLVWPAHNWPTARFEVDGKRHFKQVYTMRRVQDVQKDAVVGQLGVSMLRLHELDLGLWPAKIAAFVANLNGNVRWTPAYHACLTPQQRFDII